MAEGGRKSSKTEDSRIDFRDLRDLRDFREGVRWVTLTTRKLRGPGALKCSLKLTTNS